MRDLRTFTAIMVLAAFMLLAAPAAALASDGAASGDGVPAAGQAVEPSPDPSPAPTPSLTLTATPATVTAGDTVRLVIRLGIPNATVRLSRLRTGQTDPTPLRRLVTGPDGVAVCRVTPPVGTVYRVDYAGDGALWSPATAEVAVAVRPRVALAVAGRVYRGRRSGLTVTVRPLHPGAAVTVQRYADGAWTDWRTLTLDSASRAETSWRADAVGVARLRVVVPEDAEHLFGASAVRRVRVVKPNPYNVPLDAKGIIVVDISQYTLRFYSYGRLLRTFPCVTGRPGLPTPIGRFKVYARGMWPGGPYGSRIMSYHPPCAIHGTNEPHLLSRFPRNFSHGCTRLYNHHAIWLYDHSPLGTPVWNVP